MQKYKSFFNPPRITLPFILRLYLYVKDHVFFFSHGSTVLFLRAIKWNIRRDVKQFTRLCGYRETRARKLMNSYVADELMERIPYSRGYYRPTKGNFGRE